MPSNERHRQNAGNVSTQAGQNSSNDANINEVAKLKNFFMYILSDGEYFSSLNCLWQAVWITISSTKFSLGNFPLNSGSSV